MPHLRIGETGAYRDSLLNHYQKRNWKLDLFTLRTHVFQTMQDGLHSSVHPNQMNQ